ncbi:MAG: DUF2147 domain-containing protein [Spongiibacteraceae bacterium]|jgi:uncharacterized protein (DUF2147 family)|nr:DUF2147 domain-containing protein [Spongiibacteraceae bacterium]
MRTLALLLMLAAGLAQADVTGRWKTIDDETGLPKSIVELSERDGKLFGRVTELLSRAPDTRCDKCKGERRGQPIVGMEIISGLERDGDAWSGGKILDPANGKEYRARLWLDDAQHLKVRGYLGVFYRTQVWERADD